MYDKVEYMEGDGYPWIVFRGTDTDDGGVEYEKIHQIPIQAIADRMELLGLESIEQTLEYIGLEVSNGEVSDTLHEPMQDAYREVVQSEYAQTLMPVPVVDEAGQQTLFAPMSIGQSKRDKLEEVRDESLSKLGMQSRVHSEPMSRVMDDSRPVDRTTPAASAALGATEEAAGEAVRMIQEHMDEVRAWRGHTVLSFTPQLLEKLSEESANP